MKIKFNDIINYLKFNDIPFELKGNPKDCYTITSLFYPEPDGFYYIENELSFDVKLIDSLILSNFNLILDEGNVVLLVTESPQEIFYKMLNFYFREESSGLICETVKIHKEALIGKNVQIDPFVVVGKCVIGDNTIIKSHTVITDNTKIGSNVLIEHSCTIGATGMAWIWDNNGNRIVQPQLGGVIIEDYCRIGAQTVIVRGSLNENSRIGTHTVIAPGARIGHGTQIGKYVHLANNVVTGGNTVIGAYCFIGSSAVFRPKIKLHTYTTVAAGAVVVKNTSKENLTLIGVPAAETATKEISNGIPKSKSKK